MCSPWLSQCAQVVLGSPLHGPRTRKQATNSGLQSTFYWLLQSYNNNQNEFMSHAWIWNEVIKVPPPAYIVQVTPVTLTCDDEIAIFAELVIYWHPVGEIVSYLWQNITQTVFLVVDAIIEEDFNRWENLIDSAFFVVELNRGKPMVFVVNKGDPTHDIRSYESKMLPQGVIF